MALAKANPGKYSYGSSGIGSIMQLVMESVKATLGIDVLHVPYKGTGQSVPAAVSNQVSLVVSAYPSLQGFAKDGKLQLIAVTTARALGARPRRGVDRGERDSGLRPRTLHRHHGPRGHARRDRRTRSPAT